MLRKYTDKFLKMDRRIIFALLTLMLFIPLIKPLGLPNKTVGVSTQQVHDFIENMKPGSFILISLDYDPSTRPELHPQAKTVISHCFRKDVRVAVMTFLPGATGLIEEIFATIPKEYNKKEGIDYVVLPYQPNPVAIMTQLGSDIYTIYDKDKNDTPTKNMPVMEGITNYRDMAAVMCITGTALLDYWIAYAGDKYHVPMLGGVTAVSQPSYGPYLQKGQLKGLIGGMKGAADYEKLIGKLGKGTKGIDALNLAHLLVLFLIITSNIMLFFMKRS
ncbi:MAG: hypothetical protein KKD35_08085 [Elusimicrobia bacterium]|nr:hypothetical protein [Elusimicrobiota bacterium]